MRSAAVVAVRDVPLRIADVEETTLLQADVVDAEWLADPFVHRAGELAERGQRGRSAVVVVRVVAIHGAREGVVRSWRQRFEARDSHLHRRGVRSCIRARRRELYRPAHLGGYKVQSDNTGRSRVDRSLGKGIMCERLVDAGRLAADVVVTRRSVT